jgi:putative phosphoesterase
VASDERIAVVSDVHSNLPALEAVLEEIVRRGLKRVLCAGDSIGYYTFPNEVLDLLRGRRVESIAGNHEMAAMGADVAWFNAPAGEAIQWTMERLTEANWGYLHGLPRRLHLDIGGKRVAIIHGSPYDDDEYVYPHVAHRGLLEAADADILILGHTHVPMTRVYPEGIIVNPGSVGQPRDRDPRAALGILEPDEMAFEVVRIPYDAGRTMKGVVEAGLHEFLAERLMYGR